MEKSRSVDGGSERARTHGVLNERATSEAAPEHAESTAVAGRRSNESVQVVQRRARGAEPSRALPPLPAPRTDGVEPWPRSETRAEGGGHANHIGLPDALKAGVERLSGISLDRVRVHYNSDRPARLQARAYTQGLNIHLAPGEDRQLPHEAWHVVQQAQGRVHARRQFRGVSVNDASTLEREADEMGMRAQRCGSTQDMRGKEALVGSGHQISLTPQAEPRGAVVQMRSISLRKRDEQEKKEGWLRKASGNATRQEQKASRARYFDKVRTQQSDSGVRSDSSARAERSLDDMEEDLSLAVLSAIEFLKVNQSETVAGLEANFRSCRGNFLTQFGLSGFDLVYDSHQRPEALELRINPKARVSTTPPYTITWGNEHLSFASAQAPDGANVARFKVAKLAVGGAEENVGVCMEVDYLGPNHPQGSAPKPRALKEIMKKLPTMKNNSAPNKYVKGHLLNDNLGGPGEPPNLFPITAAANMEHERQVERLVKKWVNDDGCWVKYKVTVGSIGVTGSRSRGWSVSASLECEAYAYTVNWGVSNLYVKKTIESSLGSDCVVRDGLSGATADGAMVDDNFAANKGRVQRAPRADGQTLVLLDPDLAEWGERVARAFDVFVLDGDRLNDGGKAWVLQRVLGVSDAGANILVDHSDLRGSDNNAVVALNRVSADLVEKLQCVNEWVRVRVNVEEINGLQLRRTRRNAGSSNLMSGALVGKLNAHLAGGRR